MATVDNDRFLGALQTLLDRVHLVTPGQVPDVVAAGAAELGWTTTMYFVDYEQRHLVPVSATLRIRHQGERVARQADRTSGNSPSGGA